MTPVVSQYPVLWGLAALSTLLAVLAVRLRRGGGTLTALAGLCAVGMVVAALACSVPYTEILALLLAPVLACALALGKGERP